MRAIDTIYLTGSRYPLPVRMPDQVWSISVRARALLSPLILLLLAGINAVVPAADITAHNILHHLNFLPLMIAGMLFGWRGASMAALFAALLNTPLIVRHWVEWPLDAKDQVVELVIFSAAGLIAGYLSDLERAQRKNLEETRQQLEDVYLELRENLAAMKRAERLSAAGQLAASLAHEIRNPLASISGAAGILQRGAARPEYLHDSLEIIQTECQRLNKLLTGFLNFAKPRSPRLQSTDVNALVLSVVSLASHRAETCGIRIFYDRGSEPHEIACDPEQLRQVLLNLVINAIEASTAGTTVHLRTRMEKRKLLIEVEDGGSGIPADVADHIFDPFFTTKPDGTGLGLAISSMIATQHGGTLSFHDNDKGGTTFQIDLPADQEIIGAK